MGLGGGMGRRVGVSGSCFSGPGMFEEAPRRWARQSEGAPGWTFDLLIFRDEGNPVRPSACSVVPLMELEPQEEEEQPAGSIVLRGQQLYGWKLRNIRPSRNDG